MHFLICAFNVFRFDIFNDLIDDCFIVNIGIFFENFKVIRQTYPELPIHVRTPIIPGFNDNDKDVKEIADFVSSFDNVRYELLKYHRLGQAKYEDLHRAYPLEDKTLDEGVFTGLKRYQFNHISSQLEDIGWQKGAGI